MCKHFFPAWLIKKIKGSFLVLNVLIIVFPFGIGLQVMTNSTRVFCGGLSFCFIEFIYETFMVNIEVLSFPVIDGNIFFK